MKIKEFTKENIIENFDKVEGFIKHNNMHIESIEDNKVILYAKVNKKSLNPFDIVHGGLIFGLADTAMGTLCILNGRKGVTIDTNISYLRPCKVNIIRCIATPIKEGLTIGVYKAEIYNSNNELAAVITANFMYINK